MPRARAIPCLLAAWLLAFGAAGPGRAEDAPADPWARYRGFDPDGDGRAEIVDVRAVRTRGEGARGVLVLVEPRLLEPLAGAPDLRPGLLRMADDLAAEGRRAEVLAVALPHGTGHRDGRLLLAVRELVRAVHRERGLEAVVLVGRFPDAMLVRTVNWRKKGRLVLRKGRPDVATWDDVRYLRRRPELVAHRADVVLADLDGAWEDVYVQPRTALRAITAVFPDGVPAGGGPCADLELHEEVYEDFFHVDDGRALVRLVPAVEGEPARVELLLEDDERDAETAAADRERPNPLGRPEIAVSRLDARGTALRPRGDVAGVDGAHLLDADGRPQAVRFAAKADVPHWRDRLWEADPVLERRLLAEYLDRNHAYRTGGAEVVLRATSLACGLPSGLRQMRKAGAGWPEGEPADDVRGKPTLVDAAAWLGRPALLRTLRAHSDPWGSVFAKAPAKDLRALLGEAAPWSWTPRGERLVPSLDAACGGGKLDWFLLRTLYEAGAIAPQPAFYHHTGCEGVSPPGARRRPYDDPAYGVRQGAEALLFFGRGLALVGRAKVFYDEPRGFAEALRDGRTFGEAWQRYFEVESQGPTWGKVGGDIGRKRAYFWSVLGDATLRMPPPDGDR